MYIYMHSKNYVSRKAKRLQRGIKYGNISGGNHNFVKTRANHGKKVV